MTIGAIGDIHSRSIWKEIIKNDKIDIWVFIGDYFDTRHGGYSANSQIQNFKDILEFKKANMDKVILLFGNHSFHYLKGVHETYSGYQANYAIDIGEVIHQALNENLVQMCFKYDKYVFTHAGVTKTWCKSNDIDITNLEQSINDLFKYKPNSFRFTIGPNFSNTGNDITQTPIWVRPEALKRDILDDIICVVGHTSMNELTITDNIILIDTLGTSEEYLIIEDGMPRSGKIELV